MNMFSNIFHKILSRPSSNILTDGNKGGKERDSCPLKVRWDAGEGQVEFYVPQNRENRVRNE
jgi:hypothetical protein